MQPDVLELLVQSGADLEARTKNGESPLDICEDPELKERIVQLKNEMETKRNSSHSNRLKRSHSSNTRTQSVRRTSIREKSQISRREAKLEAKMRSQGMEGNSGVTETDTDTDGHDGTTGHGTTGHGDVGHEAIVRTSASGVMPDLLKTTVTSSSRNSGQESDRLSSSNGDQSSRTSKIDVNGSSCVPFDTSRSKEHRSSKVSSTNTNSHKEPLSTVQMTTISSSSSQSTENRLIECKSSEIKNLESRNSENRNSENKNPELKNPENKKHERRKENQKSSKSDRSQVPAINTSTTDGHKHNHSVIKNPGYSDQDCSSDTSKAVEQSGKMREEGGKMREEDGKMRELSGNLRELSGNLMEDTSKREDTGSDEGARRKSSGESVKVEIHVTVNTNQSPTSTNNGLSVASGTLADLKKQRTERRGSDTVRNSLVNGMDTVDTSPSTGHGDETSSRTSAKNNSTTIRARYVVDTPIQGGGSSYAPSTTVPVSILHHPPPSPSRPNIFRGDPSEVVGGSDGYHKQGCCTIS